MIQFTEPSANLLVFFQSTWKHKGLILAMAKREILGKYRGSFLGLLWSFLYPLFMLAVYTFVFSVVFKAKWGNTNASDSKIEFALILFSGLIIYNFFSECVGAASSLIVGNQSFVKRVIFPLEVLPVITLITSMFHMFVSFFILISFFFFAHWYIHWTILLIPFLLFPLLLIILGIAYFLASLGTFVRDMGQVINLVLTLMLFASPIFFPLKSLPAAIKPFAFLNPIAFFIEEIRNLVIWGNLFDIHLWLIYFASSFIILWIGFAWFQKTRKAFADVL